MCDGHLEVLMAQLVSDLNIAIDRLGRRAGTLTCGHSGGVDQRLHLERWNSSRLGTMYEDEDSNSLIVSRSMKAQVQRFGLRIWKTGLGWGRVSRREPWA